MTFSIPGENPFDDEAACPLSFDITNIYSSALTMMWQMWTAFGIMLGFVSSLAFQNTDFLGEYSQWRWMLASTAIPPFFVCIQVYFCPESPRWYDIQNLCRVQHSLNTRQVYGKGQIRQSLYSIFKTSDQ